MEKKNNKVHEQSKLRAFLTGDRIKAALPLIGFVIFPHRGFGAPKVVTSALNPVL